MEVKFCNPKLNYLKYKFNIIDELEKGEYIEGKSVTIFENNFANYIGMKHCIGVGNGTDALEIAIASLNLPQNSEIIVQGNTYVATCMAVLNNTHNLVLADVENNNIILNITPNTKVIIVVHMYGIPLNNMDMVIDICMKNNIILIEDCAQAHGAFYNNRRVGSFGYLSCFSFYPTKNLGACGDGGCIMTNSDELNKWIRMYKNFGSVSKNNHIMVGRNSRLDTIQASILNTKLTHLDDDNNMRRQNAKYYYELLKNINIPHTYSDNNVYHLFTILVDDRDELILYLKKHNIETAIHYPTAICDMWCVQFKSAFIPEELGTFDLSQPSLVGYMTNRTCGLSPTHMNIFNTNNTPHCQLLAKKILSLPMYPELTYEEIKYVCDHINTFFRKKSNNTLKTITVPEKHGDLNYMNVNFDCKRIFYIDNITKVPCIRGNHAIINFSEFIIIISGSILLKLIDRNNNIISDDILNKNDTYHINNNTWIEYTILEVNTIIIVMCDMDYNNSIIENDFKQFIFPIQCLSKNRE